MAQVIGVGETVLDIVFNSDHQPLSAKPGGSVYNAMISIARAGFPAAMITETGDDLVGSLIRTFLRDNGIDDSLVTVNAGCQSHLALAFLDEQKKANYEFYKNYQTQCVDFKVPTFSQGDFLLFGSYFAINPLLRPSILPLLTAARSQGALLYYDVNFRKTHQSEAEALWPTIAENMRLAHIVKGSDEDIAIMLGTDDWRRAYQEVIRPLCPYFICTKGGEGATLLHPGGEIPIPPVHIKPVSTIGAGDSFNAGTLCGLLKAGVSASDAESREFVDHLATSMVCGVQFATEVCLILDNYIEKNGTCALSF